MRPHWTRGRTDARYVIYLPSSPLLPSSAVKKRSWQGIDPRASTSPFSCSQEKTHFGETPSPPPAGSVPTKKRGGGRLPSSLFIANLFSRSALKTKKHTQKMRGMCFFSFSNPLPPFFGRRTRPTNEGVKKSSQSFIFWGGRSVFLFLLPAPSSSISWAGSRNVQR